MEIDFLRAGQTFHARLEEPTPEADAYPYKPQAYQAFNFPGLSFGLCLPGSFHLQYLKQIHRAILDTGARRSLVIASPFYRDLVTALLAELPLPEGVECDVVVPQNEFFGGNVSIGDLWVLEDIARSVHAYVKTKGKPDLVLACRFVPLTLGRDLRRCPRHRSSGVARHRGSALDRVRADRAVGECDD